MKKILVVCFVMLAGLVFTPKSAFACRTEVSCYALAKKGNAEAQYLLGYIYFNGTGVPRDYPEAQKWFRKAAEQRHVDAQYILGYMYVNNLGTPIEFDKALAPYLKDFEKGFGDIYNEKNIAAYLAEAKKYQKVIDQGYKDGISGRNTRYKNVFVKWIQKFWNAGFKDVLKSYKQGIEKLKASDYAEALKWFRHSAKKGNADAQYQLGLMYAKGQGVKQNYVVAYAWFSVAAIQGIDKASQARDNVAKKLSDGQLLRARALAKKYYRKYVEPYL